MNKLKVLQSILRCPITKSNLVLLNQDELVEVNHNISKGDFVHSDGTPVSKHIEQGFISPSTHWIYPIIDGIIVLLPSLAIKNQKDVSSTPLNKKLYGEKESVQKFYDEIGWNLDENSVFKDAAEFEDLREVTREYRTRCHLKVNNYISKGGDYFLDIASGPVQYPEYLSYSKNFKYKILGDFSFQALKKAKEKLGNKGIYVLCDITNLPFKDASIDGVISLHTIYHVPSNEQKSAFHEIYRVLEIGSKAAVVYSWGKHSLFMAITLFLPRLLWKFLNIFKNMKKERLELYFHAHSYRWFKRNIASSMQFDIKVWRSITVSFSKIYIHRFLFGKFFLSILYNLEERYPKIIGRLGAYPLFIFRK